MAKKVVLFYPKTDSEGSFKNIPLSVLKIGSELKGAGYDVITIDERFEDGYQKKLAGALEQAVFFGVSAMTGYQIYGAMKASAFVKRIDKDMPVVWGGWHSSLLPEETLANQDIDIVVRGQGERTVCELAKVLQARGDLNGISGISFKKEGKIISNSPRELEDINAFHPVSFDTVDIERYIFKGPLGERSIFWNSSQGCPYRCGFCSTPTVYHRRWSGLKAETLLGQLRRLVHDYRIDAVTFAEDNFFVDAGRIEKFCSGLIESKLNIKWATDVRVDQVVRFSEDLIDLLKASGCAKLYIGAESGDQEVLDLIDKKILLEDIYKSAEKLYKHKIISEFFMIVGFPVNPKKDLEKSLELIRRVKSRYPDHQFTPFLYTPYPGTPLLDRAITSGLEVPKKLEDWARWSILSVSTPWVNKRYLDSVNRYSKCVYPLAFPSEALKKRFETGFGGRLYMILHKLEQFRVKNNFFLFPLEWKLIKVFHAMQIRYNLFKDVESFR